MVCVCLVRPSDSEEQLFRLHFKFLGIKIKYG